MGRKVFSQFKYDEGIRLVRELGFKQLEAARLVGLHPQTLHNYIQKRLAQEQEIALQQREAFKAVLPGSYLLEPSSIRQLTKQELMCGKANGYGKQKVSA